MGGIFFEPVMTWTFNVGPRATMDLSVLASCRNSCTLFSTPAYAGWSPNPTARWYRPTTLSSCADAAVACTSIRLTAMLNAATIDRVRLIRSVLSAAARHLRAGRRDEEGKDYERGGARGAAGPAGTGACGIRVTRRNDRTRGARSHVRASSSARAAAPRPRARSSRALAHATRNCTATPSNKTW